jgi:hypothetical protein
MSELRFDAGSHTYTLGEKQLPSVTQILKPLTDFSGVPAEVLERAKNWGTAVHKMIELDLSERLNTRTLDAALDPVYSSWLECKPEVLHLMGGEIQSEVTLFNKALGYAGTADLVGKDAVLDIKTGLLDLKYVGPQTAAYATALGVKRRYCLHLPLGKPAKIVRLTDQRDWSIFVSCLNIHTWRKS